MKKIILSLIALFIAIVSVNAQDVQLATVQHGTEMQAFYGSDAFKSAIAAAQTGDIISLSGGNYNSATIDKAVTIQGAGYVDDFKNNRYRTHFVGDMSINLPEGAEGLYLEGISVFDNVTIEGTVKSMYFGCCLMTKGVTVKSESTQLSFMHCRINKLMLTGVSHSAQLRNCAIDEFHGSSNNQEDGVVENCVIRRCFDDVIRFTFKNNILYNGDSYRSASNSVNNSYYYNLINIYQGFPSSAIQEGNTGIINSNGNFLTKIFGSNSSNYMSALNLTEEGKKYLGADGTEVGIHGGSTPFTDYTSVPQITQKVVAPQSDVNGKLSVKFVIEAK